MWIVVHGKKTGGRIALNSDNIIRIDEIKDDGETYVNVSITDGSNVITVENFLEIRRMLQI